MMDRDDWRNEIANALKNVNLPMTSTGSADEISSRGYILIEDQGRLTNENENVFNSKIRISLDDLSLKLYDHLIDLATDCEGLYRVLEEGPNKTPDPEEDDGMTHLDGDSTQLDKDKVNAMVPEDVVSENYVLHKENYLNSLLNTWGSVGYADQDISGTIYAQGNIKIDIGRGSRLNLTGTMVAYGNDPSTGRPGGSGSTTVTEDGESLRAGSITMVAQQVDLAANPNYTRGLLDQIPCAHVKRVMYAVY